MKVCSVTFLCLLSTIPLHAQVFNVLGSFDGTNGEQPWAAVVQGIDGNFYGTTASGGAFGQGAIFKVASDGTVTGLYSFCPQSKCPDGRQPDAALIQATNGNFYGTTTFGGIDGNDGTIFRITPQGKFTSLYEFCTQSGCPDGRTLYGGLIQGTDGNLYGTTNEGGDLNCFAPYGCGTVFKITLTGKLTVLHTFHPGEGGESFATVVQATDGNFYGTTEIGGEYDSGTVFRVTPSGVFTTLYDFCAQELCVDGAGPRGPLMQASDGNLYGTTSSGGESPSEGTVFRITPRGALTVLHSFTISDGSNPYDGLVEGTDGKLYGTTPQGGNVNDGTAFSITFDGTFTMLFNFGFLTNSGSTPNPVIQGTDGKFYGTTMSGGADNDGEIFTLDVGLGPFVSLPRPFGKVGTQTFIQGQGLTDTKRVSFGGTPAIFKIVSDTLLNAKVPAGATSGLVTVTTASDKLKSNVPFRVLPQLLSFDPPSGPPGTQVTITGVSLTQTLGVGFGDRVQSQFTVNSDTSVTATVPQGAKTGKIGIETKGGVAISSGTFEVTE